MSAIAMQIEVVNVEDVPEVLRPWWNYIVLLVTSVPWTILAGVGRNIFGYLRERFRLGESETFDVNKFNETVVFYVGGITTILSFTSLLPDPWNTIIGSVLSAVLVLIDLLKSEVGHLREKKKR